MQPYVGQIMLFAGSFAPVGYLPCDGRILSIAQYEVLFVLLGTTFGGDGQATFGLPDLRGRVSVGAGSGGGTTYSIGQNGGVEQVTLSTPQLPQHNHLVATAGPAATVNTPTGGAIFADQTGGSGSGATANAYGPYTAASQANLAGNTVGFAPGVSGLPHENRQPLLAITVAIATQGVYPSPS
jgi:microcystin-dependent protein